VLRPGRAWRERLVGGSAQRATGRKGALTISNVVEKMIRAQISAVHFSDINVKNNGA
jgi:hypothetical protein